jgi:hypothetical protein
VKIKERDNLGDLGIGGKKIWKWTLKKYGEKLRTAFIRLRTEASGGISKLPVLQKTEDISISWATVGFSRALLHEVSRGSVLCDNTSRFICSTSPLSTHTYVTGEEVWMIHQSSSPQTSDLRSRRSVTYYS